MLLFHVIQAAFGHLSLDQNAQVVSLYQARSLNVVLAPRHLEYSLIQACPDDGGPPKAECIAGSMGGTLGKFPGFADSQTPRSIEIPVLVR
ncbi:hypothetical protein M9458_035964, partial [Cirrhinus mrigala]